MNGETPTQPWLRLHLLGGCEIQLSKGTARLETAKTRALLVYLSLNPGPQSRSALAGLLWGDLPERKARRNLRRGLWNLRHRIAAPQLPPLLLSTRETVGLNPHFPRWLDVAAFEEACAELEATSAADLSAPRLEALGQALALYKGEFLQGFYVNDAPAFEAWALGERERLRLKAMQALERLTAAHAARGETEKALDCAHRLLALEPWREESHRWLMRLLARAGRRTAALAQYETCRRILAQELGVEPAAETVALERRIRAGSLGAPASRLPAATTPFIGRERELAEIADLLGQAECRLLTVTGLGGAGKTRVALEVAAQLAPLLADGVFYVELGNLHAPEQIPGAIAQALHFPLPSPADPWDALQAYLREKQMLLLLDGFEHLLAGAPLLSQMRRAAPGLKLLVTSRARLNLQGEWVYPLDGLAFPPDERDPDLTSYDAVRLFLQTASRVHLGFQMGREDWPHLVRICRLTAGLPLAIEMAAAWVRVLSLEEIAQDIAHSLDLLVVPLRDVPEHHRSIRAVFERSWQLLAPEERRILARLSVFRGSFRLAEAQRITGASFVTLAALVDKSLLRRLPSGRYRFHALLHQYAAEQLERDPGAQERAREAHCRAYADLLAPYRQARDEGRPMPLLALAGQEIDNLRVAWDWAIAEGNVRSLEAMYAALADYFHLHTAFREGEAFFRQALEALGWLEEGEEPGMLPWRLRACWASFAVYLGQFGPARAALERCLTAFSRRTARDDMAHAQFFLGEIARFTGDNASAARLLEQSLANYRQAGNRSAVGFCLNGLGVTSLALGELTQARSYLQEALAAFEAIGHEMGAAIAGINLTDLLMQAGDCRAAEEILNQSFDRCQHLGHRWGMAVCLLRRGDLAGREGRHADAKAAYHESLEMLQEIGQRQTAAGCLVKLGGACRELGDYAKARRHLEKALALTLEIRNEAGVADVALNLALLLKAEGATEKALELALAVASHPAGTPAIQGQAARLAADLSRRVPEETAGRVAEWVQGRTLESALAELLPPPIKSDRPLPNA